MTRKEAKARLKFIAEWWSPSVARPDTTGCIIQIASDQQAWCGAGAAAKILGLPFEDVYRIMFAWDRKAAAKAMRLIEAL